MMTINEARKGIKEIKDRRKADKMNKIIARLVSGEGGWVDVWIYR